MYGKVFVVKVRVLLRCCLFSTMSGKLSDSFYSTSSGNVCFTLRFLLRFVLFRVRVLVSCFFLFRVRCLVWLCFRARVLVRFFCIVRFLLRCCFVWSKMSGKSYVF